MACQAKYRLLLEYDIASRRFSQAVRDYRIVPETSTPEHYQLLNALVEEARRECEAARQALESHDREHQCGAIDGTAAQVRRLQNAASSPEVTAAAPAHEPKS